MATKNKSKMIEEDFYSVSIKNLCLKAEEKEIFSDFSIEFKPQKITGLIAPSGWGKTTLLNWISKNFKNVSYAFQDLRLLENESVLKNITIPLSAGKKSSLKKTDESLPELITACLKNLELLTLSHKKVSALSGGERQRVSLARALLFESDILLLDEPFQNLNQSLKLKIMTYIKQMQEQSPRTVIFVTHDKTEADFLCDEIIFFD